MQMQVEKVMKALFIRKLHLWPRFETTAKDVLDAVDKDIQVCLHLTTKKADFSRPLG